MTATTIRVQMAQRKDTAANWTAANPILLSGEIGYETDTEKFKIGDGTTNWNSLAYLPIPDGSGNLTITGNLEIGTTGTLTFEGSTADGFETTLAVTDPTADRTITLPNVSGTVITTGDTGSVTSTMIADGTIVNADVSATAEIAVSKLANGTANQVLVTDGTDVSWSDDLTLAGNLTVNGTTTTVNTETLVVEDKNIELGVVGTPTDLTADGGGITLKGTTDKTINWVDATDSWTSSEHVDLASSKSYRINGAEVLNATTLGGGVTGSSLTSVGTISSGTWQGTAIDAAYLDSTVVTTGDTGTVTSTMIADGTIVNGDINASAAIAGTKISPDFGSQNVTTTGTSTAASFIPTSSTVPANGVYLPAANSVALSTSGAEALRINADGDIQVADGNRMEIDEIRARDAAGLKLFDDAGAGIFIQDGGSVGIGTSSPGALLDVNNVGRFLSASPSYPSAGKGVEIYFDSAGDLGYLQAYDRSGSAWKGLTLAGDTVRFRTAGNEVGRFDASGRLGIGSSTPGDYYADADNLVVYENGNSGITIASATTGNGSLLFADGTTGTSEYAGFIVYAHNDNSLQFGANAGEAFRVDSSRRLLVGTSSSIATAGGFTPSVQVAGTGALAAISTQRYANNANGAGIALQKSRNGTIGSHTVVTSGDTLGVIEFEGSDGSAFVTGARIEAAVDATPGANDMPGRLVFSTTADGASSPTERVRITNYGGTFFNTTGTPTVNANFGVTIGQFNGGARAGTLLTSANFDGASFIAAFHGTVGYAQIMGDGDLENTNNRYTGLSDIKFKQNVEDASSQWNDLKAIRVRKYELIANPDRKHIGCVAQELEQVCPGLVVEREGSNGDSYKSVAYSVLYMKAVKALQEAMERIETLEAKVAALEAA